MSMNSKLCQRIVLCVSGEYFETFIATLNRFPGTLLGNKVKRRRYYCSTTSRYFFNRNRMCFEAILFFYQSNGILRRPPYVRLDVFEDECRFFELPDCIIDQMKFIEGILPELDLKPSPKKQTESYSWKRRLWDILENPETSTKAWMFSVFSLSTIFLSIIISCIDTLGYIEFSPRKLNDNAWSITELILNLWFFIELVSRFATTPDRKRFLKSFRNWIDLFAVVPYLLLYPIQNQLKSLGFLRSFRFLRIIRLVRLSRLSKVSRRIRIVALIFKSSLRDFQNLFCCHMTTIVLGGTMMYYAEQTSRQTQFTNIPLSFWWAITTVTTIGYGDLIPITIYGKCIAICFMVIGALTTSLPILSIGIKFQTIYQNTLSPRQ